MAYRPILNRNSLAYETGNFQTNGANDLMIGDTGADKIIGNKGKDLLLGNAGKDTLEDTDKKLVISGTKLGAGNQITVNNVDIAKLTGVTGTEGYLGLKLDRKYMVAVVKGGGTNVFTQSGFTLDQLAGKTTNLVEGTGCAFTLCLNQAAREGDTITLALSSLGDKFKAILGDTTVNANGAVLTLAEGQTQISFALVQTGEVTADASTQISATYTGADGSATSNSFGVNLQDTGATAQTMKGDQRAKIIGVGKETQQWVTSDKPTYATYAWGETSWGADGTLVGGKAQANFSDVLRGTGANDKIFGRAEMMH